MPYDVMDRRAPRGYTKGPCPGCGTPTLMPKGGVCQDCSAKLAAYAQWQAEQRGKADERVYGTKERSYAFPGLHLQAKVGDKFHGTDAISEPLWRLHQLVSTPAPEGIDWKEVEARGADAYTYDNDREWRNEWIQYRIFPVAVADALRDLHKGIVASLKKAEADGHERGRSLLMGLASGNITNDEFNRTAARLDEQRPDDPEKEPRFHPGHD